MPTTQDGGWISRLGPVTIDWPGSLGYFGGIALATSVELIEPPLALFIAAIPFFDMLNQPGAPLPFRLVSRVLDGVAKPVGGENEHTVQVGVPDEMERAAQERRLLARVQALEQTLVAVAEAEQRHAAETKALREDLERLRAEAQNARLVRD